MIVSLKKGKKADSNPWHATSLEWLTPNTPPKHGNWGHELPTVYRWAYDYSVPGTVEDYIPQNQPPDATHMTVDHSADDEEQVHPEDGDLKEPRGTEMWGDETSSESEQLDVDAESEDGEGKDGDGEQS